MIKKLISAFLVLAMVFSISPAAFADEGSKGFTDVEPDAWYADAVAYVQENNLIDGVSESEFAPNTPASRITLAVALYRAGDSPAVTAPTEFSDVEDGTEQSNAVSWASENDVVSGYGNGIFGTYDSITREQIASIFWRYAGSPSLDDDGSEFADQDSISEWAQAAVAWARSSGVINGKPNNLFDPQGTATRAEVAILLMNYLTGQSPDSEEPEPQQPEQQQPEQQQPEQQQPEQTEASGKTLVVYFSMPETTNPDNMTQDEDNSVVVINGEVLGNTQYIAYLIQENTGADIFRIEPKTPYPTQHDTLVDLASEEQSNNARPELAANIENIEQYDVIFLGYPTWWADMPMVLYSFLESVDLSGKTIIPFNTHGGSGFSDTINTITKLQPNATVEKNGFTVSRNSAESAESNVITWLREQLGIIE